MLTQGKKIICAILLFFVNNQYVMDDLNKSSNPQQEIVDSMLANSNLNGICIKTESFGDDNDIQDLREDELEHIDVEDPDQWFVITKREISNNGYLLHIINHWLT